MSRMKKILLSVAVLALTALGAGFAYKATLQLDATAPVYASGGLAIQGYDPVAYFTQSAAMKGESRFSHDWNGVTWRFASAEHRAAFQADPERYAPQFGGYCAYAVANGYTAKTDPRAWHIEDGKLYLNFNDDVRTQWHGQRHDLIRKGHRNWPGVIQD